MLSSCAVNTSSCAVCLLGEPLTPCHDCERVRARSTGRWVSYGHRIACCAVPVSSQLVLSIVECASVALCAVVLVLGRLDMKAWSGAGSSMPGPGNARAN